VRSSQASATLAGGAPRSTATAWTASAGVEVVGAVELAGVVVTRGTRCARFAAAVPGSGEQAAGQRAPWDDADADMTAEGDHFSFFLAVGEVVVVLHGDEGGPPRR